MRTGPDPDRLQARRTGPRLATRRRRYLCAYLGVMGPQDGVDLAVRAAARVQRAGRDDMQFVFMGGGDSFDELVALAERTRHRGVGHVHGAGPGRNGRSRCSRPPISGSARIRSTR